MAAKSYREISVSGQRIPWDTANYVFQTYLSRFDTTNTADVANKHKPTRKKVVALMMLLDEDDYKAFKNQVASQDSDIFKFPLQISGDNKSIEVLTIRVSQPLVSVDQKIIIIIEFRQYSSGGNLETTKVYVREGDKWTIWDTLKKNGLSK